jgi:curved DNA-binding protein CbpA
MLLTCRRCTVEQEDFRRVQQAFDTLSSAELRSNYDATYAPEQSMMDQIEGDDMFKCYVELKK